MLERDYHYFIFNIDELLSKYNGEYIVIKEETVIGNYTSFEDAYTEHFAWNNVSFEQSKNVI